MANYTWITDPPVTELDEGDFALEVERLRANVIAYGTGGDLLANIGHVLDAMRNCIGDPDAAASSYFSYRIDGQPVALMVMSGGMTPKIDEMTAHPGGEGAGTIMLEYAVNRSQTLGRGGRLILDSLNAASTSYWTAMGFEKYGELPLQQAQGGCRMRFNPVGNAKWTPVGDRWRLKKYADLGLTHYTTTT